MSLPILKYSTPEEFVEYYSEKLKQDLAVHNIQITKVGFIGFLLNLLGYTFFDLKIYFDSLFKEAFVATAQSEESQYTHAAVYGYFPAFATSASATGTIEFDFNNFISKKVPGVVRREVYLGYDSNKTKTTTSFQLEKRNFIIDAIYKFVEENETYYVEVLTEDANKIIIPSNSANIVAPLYSTRQNKIKEVQFSIGKYNYGSYKTYYFSIDPEYYLSDLEVYITKQGSTEEEKFEVEYVKYLTNSDSKVVFLRKLTSTNFMIEFGSGIRGQWVSDGFCRLVIKYCEGSSGNLVNDNVNLKIPVNGSVIAYDYFLENGVYVPVPSSPAIIQVPLISFSHSEGGRNPLEGDDLRIAVIKYIQTRDNLLSKSDFYNVASKYMFLSDFKFLFKKVNVLDNTFYLCRVFRDKYQEIAYSTNYTCNVMSLSPPTNVTAVPVSVAGGSLAPGQYSYRVAAIDPWGQTEASAYAIATVGAGHNAVQISWDPVPYATQYKIYGRNVITGQVMYWLSSTNSFTDTGTDGIETKLTTSAILTDLIFYPTFDINSKTFVSPFLYKGNSRMRYYEGYLIKELTFVSFSQVIPEKNVIGSAFNVPILYANLLYNSSLRFTDIIVKSYQDISPNGPIVPPGHSFSLHLTVNGVNDIVDIPMTWSNSDGYWYYRYENEDTFGILNGDIQIQIVGYQTTDASEVIKRFTVRTNHFQQIVDVSDAVKLVRYTSSGNDYLINIPVLDNDVFAGDPNYYIDKVYSFIKGSNFIENRMITDNIQTRFLNTYIIESPYTEAMFVQGKSMFSICNWLSDVLKIRNDPPPAVDIGDRYLVGLNPIGDFTGHANHIAEYSSTGWIFTIPELNDGVYDQTTKKSYVWNGTSWVNLSITLPLRLNVTVGVNKSYVETNHIDIGKEKDDLLFSLADFLQKNKTGVDVKFYNSQIKEFIHLGRDWVKFVEVSVTDSSSPVNLLNNGIELYSNDDDILKSLPSKLDIVKYTPVYIYWDVNNISINLVS